MKTASVNSKIWFMKAVFSVFHSLRGRGQQRENVCFHIAILANLEYNIIRKRWDSRSVCTKCVALCIPKCRKADRRKE